MNADTQNLRLATVVFAAAALLLALCIALIAPAGAHAQLPAICEQYPNLPECEVEPEDPNPNPNPTEIGPDDEGPGPGAGNADGGNLPFTGYPLTPLVLLLLALLASGLALRAYLAARDRMRAGTASSGYYDAS